MKDGILLLKKICQLSNNSLKPIKKDCPEEAVFLKKYV
jgi:hypothetical protein